MPQRKHRKTISLLLIFCLLLSCLPGGAIAQTTEAEPQASAAPTTAVTPADTFQLDADCQILRYVDESVFTAGNHVARLTEQETLDTYVFLNADGTQTVYYMDENVKFLDENGVVREKDITLSATRSGFATARNNVGLSLPTNLAQGITISYGGYDVNLIPENIAAATAVQQDGKIAYLNCYGKGTGLIYTPTLSGVKEDILLGMYTGVNSFSFLLNTDGLSMYQNEQGRWYLAQSANAAAKMEMADIVAYDANSRHSLGSITVTTITAGQQYRLTVTVDEDFLTAETTAYPVLIDPSITVSDTLTGANAIEDATIYQGQPNLNTGTWQFNHAGYYNSTYGLGKTVVRLSGLLSNSIYQSASADQILSATFHLREATGTAPETVKLIALNGSSTWTETSVTWNDIDTTNGRLQGSEEMSYNQPCMFYITNTVRLWKDGYFSSGQCGFLLELEDSTAAAKGFVASEYSVTDMRPYVVVHYPLEDESVDVDEGDTVTLSTVGISGTITWETEDETIATVNNGVVTGVKAGQVNITASVDGVLQKTFVVYVTIPDGEYVMKLPNYLRYMAPDTISYASNTALRIRKPTTDRFENLSKIWRIEYQGNGYYTISTIYKDDLRLTGFDGIHPALSISTTGNTHKWTIYYDQTGYVLKNQAYPNYVLTGSLVIGNLVSLSTYISSNATQKWELIATPAEGMMLLNSQNGKRADYETYTPVVFDPPTSGNIVRSLSALGLDLKVFGSTGSNTSPTWQSSNPNVVGVNSTTGTVTIKAAGGAKITASAVIDNTSYEISYKISVIKEIVYGQLQYDEKYLAVVPNVSNRLSDYAEAMSRVFLFYCNKEIIFITPEATESYADKCTTLDAEDHCNCGPIAATTCTQHPHSDMNNNLDDMENTPNLKKLMLIGHDTCRIEDGQHDFISSGTGYLGLACHGGETACVSVIAYPDSDETVELMTATHEFGHMLNAYDHYEGEGPTVGTLNGTFPGAGFSDDCIYGDNRFYPNVQQNLIICDGCSKVLAGEIPDFESKWEELMNE